MRYLLLALLMSSCVMPGTRTRIVWNPETKTFEGDLSRSWLAGPTRLEVSFKDAEGNAFSALWESNSNLDSASKASVAQSLAIIEASRAGAQVLPKIIQ